MKSDFEHVEFFEILESEKRNEIFRIDISDSEISIDDIPDLPNLSHLIAQNNSYKEINLQGKFPQLITLDLSHNKIQKITSESRPMINLHLSDNNIRNISDIEDISTSTLDLNNNPLQSLEGIEQNEHYLNLDISNTFVSDLSLLNEFEVVHKLNISNCPISDLSPLQNLSELTIFNGSYCPIKDISHLSDIEIRHLMLAGIRCRDFSPLSTILGLSSLSLSQNEIEDINLLKQHPGIRKIYLNYNKIKDITPIVHLEHLKLVSLYDNRIHHIPHLGSKETIMYFDIRKNPLKNMLHCTFGFNPDARVKVDPSVNAIVRAIVNNQVKWYDFMYYHDIIAYCYPIILQKISHIQNKSRDDFEDFIINTLRVRISNDMQILL